MFRICTCSHPYAELISSGARNFSHITLVLLQNVSTPTRSEENHGRDMGGRQVASHAILGGWPRRMDDLCGSQSSGASDNVEAEDGGDTQVLDRQGGQLLKATEMKKSHRLRRVSTNRLGLSSKCNIRPLSTHYSTSNSGRLIPNLLRLRLENEMMVKIGFCVL